MKIWDGYKPWLYCCCVVSISSTLLFRNSGDPPISSSVITDPFDCIRTLPRSLCITLIGGSSGLVILWCWLKYNSIASWVLFSVSASIFEFAVSCFQGESSDIFAGKSIACWSIDQNLPDCKENLELQSLK